jgi:hypothetical protein
VTSALSLEASLALLVADALAFTDRLTELQRSTMVAALRDVAKGGVTEEMEARYCDRLITLGCTITAPYNPTKLLEAIEGRGE